MNKKKAEIFTLIEGVEWPVHWDVSIPQLDSFYDEYLKFKDRGNDIIPYLLMYIEETGGENNCTKIHLIVIANKMLGNDSIKGAVSKSDENPQYSTDSDAYSPKWYGRLLWEEVFGK